MATILEFRRATPGAASAPDPDLAVEPGSVPGAGEIVLFPGVRYERMVDEQDDAQLAPDSLAPDGTAAEGQAN